MDTNDGNRQENDLIDLPIYTAVARLSCWIDHAQLSDDEWARFFALGKEFGFDPTVHPEGGHTPNG
jgi:hypothetical protein